MQFLRADTSANLHVGPVVSVSDGVTPVTTLSLATADEKGLIKNGATTRVDTSADTLTAIASADGYYYFVATTSHTDTEGPLTLFIGDDSLCLPVRHDWMVVNANVYDSLFAASGTDLLDVNVEEINANTSAPANLQLAFDGTGYGFTGCTMPTTTTLTNTVTLAAATHTGATIPVVTSLTNVAQANVTQWLGATVSASVSGIPMVDVAFIDAAPVSADAAQIGVNVVNWKGTAAGTVDTAGYPVVTVKDGTGAGEINTSAGIVQSDVARIGGNAQAATNLSASARSMQILTVNTGNVAATTTTAQFTGATETTADHFIGRKLFFYDSSDALFLQGTSITDSSWDAVNSEIVLTFQQLTDTPADADVAILV